MLRVFCLGLPRILAIGFGSLTLLAACQKKDAQQASAPLAVTTVKVQAKTLPFVIETVGRTEGSKEVELRARVSGILEKRVYTEGSVVRAGSVLFRIDQAPFQIALDQSRAALAEEQARNSQARRNAERIKELVAKNLISRNEADLAISAMEASDAAILRAQANVRQAELNLSYTQVVAPIGGIAGRALHSDGSLVTAGTESGLLTTVTQADPIWARFALSAAENDALRTATIKNSTLVVELVHTDGSVDPERGRVNFAGSIVDPSLGTVQLRAEFPNPGLRLLPGEYVRVRLSGGAQEALTVPQTAVLQGAKGPYVWIANAQGEAEQRLVKTGVWVGDEWRITTGLTVGESVIVDNLLKLKPGLKLKTDQAVQPQPAQQ
jgi:membrane fusion protein (multidrug efflux system)